ncbi:MAG: HEAT repeat domain-containing protein [Phormidesmis sp. RL_2_1]|nr:HEAT repeat domain-containing protein [Phormidesmis sp. RL_2_1]
MDDVKVSENGPTEHQQTGSQPAASQQTGSQQTDGFIEQVIAQITEGDFSRKWEGIKQFSQKVSQLSSESFSGGRDRLVLALIHCLKNTTDTENQWFLVRALGQFDRPDVVKALAHLLVTTSAEDIQLEVIQALTHLGNSTITTLSDLLCVWQPLAQRLLAARTLAKIRRSATIEPLLSVADDAEVEIRTIALEALGSFHDPRITPVLLAALDDQGPLCVEAIRTLGRRPDLLSTIDLLGSLQRCLHHSEIAVARESAVALGRLGGESAAIALGEALIEPLPTAVRVSIARALGWIDTPAATEALTLAFAQTVPEMMPAVKQEIARSLGQTRLADLKINAAQPLIQWLQAVYLERSTTLPRLGALAARSELVAFEAASFKLKQAVVTAVARLGVSEACDSLIPVLGDPDSRIRLYALSALKQIAPKTAQVQARAYLSFLKESLSDPQVQEHVAATLLAW